MNKLNIHILIVVFLVAGFPLAAQNLSPEDQRIVSDAEAAKSAFIQQDQGLSNMFNNSAGYAIFPNVGKGAYIVGGAAGNGAVYKNGDLVAMAELRQLDVGLQLGGQAFRQVIFFEDQATLENFLEGNFQLAGNASAVVLTEGESGSLGFKDGLAIATMPKAGAMVEISVGGQKFEVESLK